MIQMIPISPHSHNAPCQSLMHGPVGCAVALLTIALTCAMLW